MMKSLHRYLSCSFFILTYFLRSERIENKGHKFPGLKRERSIFRNVLSMRILRYLAILKGHTGPEKKES
jgi:hypothetical protein